MATAQSTRVLRVCESCGTAFDAKPSEVAAGHARFCSKACFQASSGCVLRLCRCCGSEFRAGGGEVAKGAGWYCSRECYLKSFGPLEQRFWGRVEKGVRGGCWVWTGGTDGQHGYGCFKVDGKTKKAHRISWELTKGPIPQGQHVLHRCDNPRCVNPAHLFLGTHRENMADKAAKQRGNSPRGERAPRSRLTPEQVRQIRRKYAPGTYGYRRLGREFGVDKDSIRAIVTGESWSHLTDESEGEG